MSLVSLGLKGGGLGWGSAAGDGASGNKIPTRFALNE
jgi:hypothetical protein